MKVIMILVEFLQETARENRQDVDICSEMIFLIA